MSKTFLQNHKLTTKKKILKDIHETETKEFQNNDTLRTTKLLTTSYFR